MRAWIITQDCLAEDEELRNIGMSFDSDEGTIGPRNAPEALVAVLKAGGGYAFTMKDDDGETYYRGRAIWTDDDVDEGAYGPLGDFGLPNAGCTMIVYPAHHEFDCG